MPLLHDIPLTGGMRLGVWRIDETAADLLASLSRHDLIADRVATLKPESRRLREVLAVRCLLRAMTGEEQRVDYTPDGRPQLDGRHLSISHTDGYAAVVLAHEPVGVDIERIGARVERVESHFLGDAELGMGLSAADKHLVWCAKEAAYKLLGAAYYDLRRLVQTMQIDYEQGGETGRGVMQLALVDGTGRTLCCHFWLKPDYALVWTVHLARQAGGEILQHYLL